MTYRRDYLFLDTSFLKGLIDPRDEFHEVASRLWGDFLKKGESFLTTNFIIDESLTLIRKRCGVDLALGFKNVIESTKNLKIVRVSSKDEEGVWDWFFNDWSDLSYTDCTSFALMKRLGILRAATFDEHFSRAGFKVLK